MQHDWMLALVRRHECSAEESVLDKWCASDLFVTQVLSNCCYQQHIDTNLIVNYLHIEPESEVIT